MSACQRPARPCVAGHGDGIQHISLHRLGTCKGGWDLMKHVSRGGAECRPCANLAHISTDRLGANHS